MKISLGSWAFTYGPYENDPVPFDQTAVRLSEAGYDGIEIGGFEPHITLERYPDSRSRSDVRELLNDLNLGISGYAADFGGLDPTVASNKQKYLDLFSRQLEMCSDLGAPSIRVDCVAAPGSIPQADYESAMMRLAHVWQEAAHRAQEAKVMVVWEFEPAFVFNKPSEVLALVKEVAHPNFKVLFDTSHAFMCGVVGARQQGATETLTGGVSEFLKLLRDKIGHVHLIDSDGTLYAGSTSTHTPFGSGHIDFETLTPELLAIQGIEWWCVDICFWAEAWDLIEPSLEYVKSLES